MAKIKNYRQLGTNPKPNSLEYGLIAIAKTGDMYIGNEANVPVPVYAGESALSSAVRSALGLASTAKPSDAFYSLKSLFDEKSKIVTGSYTGTGTCGASNKNSLTFSFLPRIVIIQQSTAISGGNPTEQRTIIAIKDITTLQYASTSYTYVNINWSGNSIFWYGVYSWSQLNDSGVTYRYIALG